MDVTALLKEVEGLRERILQDRHDSILRDDSLLRRMSLYDERMDVHTSTLQKTLSGLGQLAESVTRLGENLDALFARMNKTDEELGALLVRMDKTDERWNQLIDQLSREHGNGGAKQ
jgi:hypothetical protein